MKKVELKKLGITLSQLGFGAMRFPEKDGKVDQEQVNAMVKYAFDNGVNYYDTAYVYGGGSSEIALGKAIKQLKREDIYVADKLPFWGANSKDDLVEYFNTSLERLDIEYFDFYLLHALDSSLLGAVEQFEAVEFVKEMQRQGKIKYLGFSIHDDYDCLLEILAMHDWDFAQIQLNYLDLDDAPGEKGYNELLKREIPIIIMEPLKGGLLADLPERITEPYKKLGGSNVSYAFRWLAEKPGIATILSGMSTEAQMIDNVEIFKDIKPLSKEEHKAILEVEENVVKYQKVKCTGCKYCLPCPVGIEIPTIFKAWNTKSLNGTTNWISGTSIDYAMAETCIECGACMGHCPQKINIPQEFKRLIEEKV